MQIKSVPSLYFHCPLAGPDYHLSSTYERRRKCGHSCGVWLEAQLGLLALNLGAFSTVFVQGYKGAVWSHWKALLGAHESLPSFLNIWASAGLGMLSPGWGFWEASGGEGGVGK